MHVGGQNVHDETRQDEQLGWLCEVEAGGCVAGAEEAGQQHACLIRVSDQFIVGQAPHETAGGPRARIWPAIRDAFILMRKELTAVAQNAIQRAHLIRCERCVERARFANRVNPRAEHWVEVFRFCQARHVACVLRQEFERHGLVGADFTDQQGQRPRD